MLARRRECFLYVEVVWRGLYLDMQISNRNKLQVAFDWIKTAIFGRDTSRY